MSTLEINFDRPRIPAQGDLVKLQIVQYVLTALLVHPATRHQCEGGSAEMSASSPNTRLLFAQHSA